MKLNVHEIEETTKSLAYDEPTTSLNEDLVHGQVVDFEFRAPAKIDLEYYRAGQELFFGGHLDGRVVGHCARCLEEYEFGIGRDFSCVLLPRPEAEVASSEEDDVEVDVGYYDGDTIDLSPMVREQIILSLPMRALCSESCKGLCAQCGANRNTNPCSCTVESGDIRLAALRQIKIVH